MTPRRLALALSLAATAHPARGAPPPGPGDVLPFRAVERTLPNGLAVIVVPTGLPDLVSVQVAMQTGSRNEVEPGRTGFAHFFEHMMFRGTRAYPPERYEAILTRMGALSNADTSQDETVYQTTVAKEDLPRVLDMEADRFMNLDYSVEGFRTEARAILGEYEKNASNPLEKADEALRAAAFKVHPYRHTEMGFLADIEDMPEQYDYSKLFYARWYRPERATLVVAGDVAPEKVLPLVEKTFGRWKRGGAKAIEIPEEPPPAGPAYAHVPWGSPTLPWVLVAFHAPAFSETSKEWAALDLLFDLRFGETSDLHRRLVVEEQVVDDLETQAEPSVDPGLFTVLARVKRPEDALRVRDAILREAAAARAVAPSAATLADQQAHQRNAFARRLDSTEAIAETVARFAVHRRSYRTVDRLFQTRAAVAPQDVLAAARTWLTDAGLVVTTVSRDPLPAGIEKPPPLDSLAPAASSDPEVPVLTVPSKLPVATLKLLFEAGSARDPEGKEGLAALAADMIADAGSRRMRVDEIRRALHPLAASFEARADKEMVVLSGTFPRDGWDRFAEVALPQLTEPGFREEDFRRLRDAHLNALVQDLRQSNDEELAKERLQANVFAGTPYGHPALGTVAGLRAVTLDDVRAFVRTHYTRADLAVGLGGEGTAAFVPRLRAELAKLPAGTKPAPVEVRGRSPKGLELEIVEKDTLGTAISFGHPLDVRRGDPDFVALLLAKAWLGEHRSSTSHLYQRMREARGLNYGDYAYIEAFPRGMFETVPEPNVGRRAQLFEIWIRPVVPGNAQMAIRIAVHELRRLVGGGLSQEEFESTRDFLSRNVLVLEASQDREIGAALDARWYGTPDFAAYVRDGLAKLTREGVNAAIRRHLSGSDLSFVVVTKDAQALADALVADAPSTLSYDSDKPAALLEEDRRIGALKLGVRRDAIRITRAEDVFER